MKEDHATAWATRSAEVKICDTPSGTAARLVERRRVEM